MMRESGDNTMPHSAPVIRSSPFDVGALLNACIIIIIIKTSQHSMEEEEEEGSSLELPDSYRAHSYN